MKRHALHISLAMAAASLFALVSCHDEIEGLGVQTGGKDDALRFCAALYREQPGAQTRGCEGNLETHTREWTENTHIRGSETDTRAEPMTMLGGEAGVVGFAYDEWDDTARPLAMLYNKRYSFDGDILSAYGEDVRWSSIMGEAHNDNVRFCLWAPYAMEGIEVSPENHAGDPYIRYSAPSSAEEQKDLIVAQWTGREGVDYGGGIKAGAIPLVFRHVLTAVRFRAGFACKVTSLRVRKVRGEGTYRFGGGWEAGESTRDYTFSLGGKECAAGGDITGEEETLMMVPQTLGKDAAIELTYLEGDEERTLTFSLAGKEWEQGRMVTYTLHSGDAPKYVYFDLAAGPVTIGGEYSGKIYVAGQATTVSGTHAAGTKYYVYQSSSALAANNAANTGYSSRANLNNRRNCRIPSYEDVTCGGRSWGDFITDNDNVESVIEAWYSGMQNTPEDARADLKGRTGTANNITVKAAAGAAYDLIIDNVYSTFQTTSTTRKDGGITFSPGDISGCTLTVTSLGDNRLGNIFYYSKPANFVASSKINSYSKEEYIQKNTPGGSKLVFEGSGTLTVADVSTYKAAGDGWNGVGYFANHYCAAIGGNDDGTNEQADGIVVNGGVLYAGTTAAENCSAIGGGGNGYGEITINGGTVTAVASTTGTAIGGGIGYSSHGGEGRVTVKGGNVYAYNLDNRRNIPSSAIGGAGSRASVGTWGTVRIEGGYVYAYSALGTAIGGGSSQTKDGGGAVITISGGQIIAKSGRGAGLGGGSACTGGGSGEINGGGATVTISGNPIIRTGSIGGGLTMAQGGKIGSADIAVHGGDIQAQFVMAAGARQLPVFTMTGGVIRGSRTDDASYIHTCEKGGAVYMESGEFTMSGGRIENCSAVQGGAVYIESQDGESSFTMRGGEISSCSATGAAGVAAHGGAVYISGGTVRMMGGSMERNYAAGGNGGAVYISDGNFFMQEGSPWISGNAAQKGDGGGVYVSAHEGKDVTVSLLEGSITSNAADGNGGGVCVDLHEDALGAAVTVGYDGGGARWEDADPRITGNVAGMAAGGLYVRGEKAKVTIRSGMIDANKVVACVKNQDVANEGGMVELIEGLVTSVTVTYHNNVGAGEESLSYSQKLVTDTNNRLRPNTFSRNGYVFEGWNTAADGSGDDYSDAQVVNLSSDVSLWAKWRVVEISQQISE